MYHRHSSYNVTEGVKRSRGHFLSGVLRGNVVVTHCGVNSVEEVAGPRFSVQMKNKELENQQVMFQICPGDF